jgi:flagellar protein FliO/FliZ
MAGNGAAAGASYGDLLITSLLVLGAVCVAAFIAVRVLGRLLATGRARGTHLLDVVARVPLEPRRSLYVVEVAGKTLLVGTSEMGLSVLSELDGGEVKSRVQAQQSFGDLVRAAWQRRKGRAAAHGSERGFAGEHAAPAAEHIEPAAAPAVAAARDVGAAVESNAVESSAIAVEPKPAVAVEAAPDATRSTAPVPAGEG